MTDPYSGTWGRIVRPGGSGMPRPMGSGLAGRMVRPMGNARGCNQWVTHRYYSATGAEIWRADHGSVVRAIAVDSSGNVYTAGGLSSNPAHYKLQKWTSSGSRVWGVLVDSDAGYDVSVDTANNIWLAVGDKVEKYSPSGTLLLSVTPIDSPIFASFTSYCANIKRVAAGPFDRVAFGADEHVFEYGDTYAPSEPRPYLMGNTCLLDGTDQAVFDFPAVPLLDLEDDSLRVLRRFPKYEFDSNGKFYVGLDFVTNRPILDGGSEYLASTGISFPKDPSVDYAGRYIHEVYGISFTDDESRWFEERTAFESPIFPHYAIGGRIAVHKPTGTYLTVFGESTSSSGPSGEIKYSDTFLVSEPYLRDEVSLVAESSAGHNGVLAVNDNHRYVYGVDAVGATIRVRDYPNTFRWQADHKTEVNDAIIKADNTVLIGGERVYDDCVPVGLAAVAGCTNTGIVTVYEIDGSVRWSKTLLTSTSVNHDVCFDASGGIWARNGDGSQLVHTDPTGIILTDVDIDSVSGQPSAPAIAFSAGGLAYCNQPDVISDSPYQVAVAASGPLLTPGGVFHLTEKHIGITNAGKVVAWDGSRYGIYAADGTLEYYGDFGNVVLGFSNLEAAAVSPTGDYLYWLAYSTTYSKVYIGTVNLNTGVVSGGTDTSLTNVTAAWCTPSGTPYYGATSLGILPSSTFPSNIYKISGGTNRIVVAAGSKLELWTFALGNYSRNWTKSVSSVSCDYFRG